MSPDEVTSTYEYEYCAYRVVNADGSITCRDVVVAEIEVAPLVPPFSYNNLCSSALLTSFIPVFILVTSLQIILPVLQLCIFTAMRYNSVPKSLRRVLFGVFWPEVWPHNNNSTSESIEPLSLMKANRIITTDILNPLLVLCTFGICSPYLSLVILASVTLKYHMWVMLLGRFIQFRYSMSSQSDRDGEDLAVVILSRACLPVINIVGRCLWPVIWSSSFFFAFLCWDVLGDEVGWRNAAWAPVVVVSVPLTMWIFLNYVKCTNSTTDAQSESFNEDDISQVENSNPLHKSISLTKIGKT